MRLAGVPAAEQQQGLGVALRARHGEAGELHRGTPAARAAAASGACGCSLGLQPRLQPQVHAVAASNAWGCSLRRMGLQPPMRGLQPAAHAVAAHHSVRARAPMSEMSSRPSSRVVLT